LVALRFEDVRFEEEGLVLILRRSKTNQEGRHETIAVAYGSEPTTCPVRAVRAWLAAAGIVAGPLFCGLTSQGGLRPTALVDRMVAYVVKRRCRPWELIHRTSPATACGAALPPPPRGRRSPTE